MISPADDVRWLIELDALLDTRLATVSFLDPQHVSTLLRTTYHTRDNDQFQSKLFSVLEYQQAYANRNVQTTMAAGPTGLHQLMSETIQIDISERDAVAGPYVMDVDVNTYPYRLQPDEQEVLTAVMLDLFPLARSIKVFYLDPKVITPMFLKTGNYTYVVMYDYQNWLNLHVPAFEHTSIPRVTLIGPKIRASAQKIEIDEADPGEKLLYESLGIFGALEMYLQEYISLRLEDVKYFSLLR